MQNVFAKNDKEIIRVKFNTMDEIKKFVADYKAADAAKLESEKSKTEEDAQPTDGAAAMAKMSRVQSLI